MATILVADDMAANRELLGSMLRHAGHEVLEAADGMEALDVAVTRARSLRVVLTARAKYAPDQGK